MELTRVSRQRAEPSAHVAPTGGDADVLALLLGGDQASASAFPATLEAAIAGGEVGDEPIAVDGGDPAGDGEGTDDGTGQSIDVALAAALALASGLPTPPAIDAAKAEAANGATAGVADTTAAGQAGIATAVGGGADAVGAEAAAQTTVGAAPDADATAAAETAPDAGAAARANADAKAAAAAAASETEAEAAATKQSNSATAPSATTATTVGDAASRDAHLTETKPIAAHGDGAEAKHGAGAGVAPERIASFSSGAEQQHGGLDLGSSARHETAPLAGEKPAAHASAVTAELSRPEALPVSHSAPDAASTTGVSATSTTATNATTTTHEATAPRTDRAGQHFGAIEPRWGERVADAMRLSSVRGGSEIRLQLEPEGLGHIDVRLHLQGDGVRAVIVAEHESTRALLTSQQQVLHEALQRSDIRLSGFTVDVGTGGGGAASFAQSDGQGNGSAPSGSTGTQSSSGNGGAGDDVESTTAAVGNGRVSVRV